MGGLFIEQILCLFAISGRVLANVLSNQELSKSCAGRKEKPHNALIGLVTAWCTLHIQNAHKSQKLYFFPDERPADIQFSLPLSNQPLTW